MSSDTPATGAGQLQPVAWPRPTADEPTAVEREVLAELIERDYRLRLEQYESARERLLSQNRPVGFEPPHELSPEQVDALWAYLCTGSATASPYRLNWAVIDRHAGRLRPAYVFRLDQLHRREAWSWTWPAADGMALCCAETGFPNMLDVQAAAEYVGLDRRETVLGAPKAPLWSPEHIAPWALAVLPEILSIVASSKLQTNDLSRYYTALAAIPALPIEARELLVDQAVGSRKGVRRLAQSVLADVPGIVDDALGRLSSSRFGEREAAAAWLADLGAVEAVPALHSVAAKEANDVAFAAELSALERLGQSIDRHLETDVLMARASKGLRKPMPAVGAWLRVDDLPGLRWADGSAVDPVPVEWMVRQAVRLRSTAPAPVVRHLFARMDPATTAAFAAELLARWIAYDTSESATESAVESKGLLSLVAAGGDRSVVAPIENYLRTRVLQYQPLLEMMTWVDDPVATQFVLSVANRFRSRAIQIEGLRQSEFLAERTGWTMEDLALRTVLDGGFDADGTLRLDYGGRSFWAHLTDDLGVVLSDEDGAAIKALPRPRVSDDDECVAHARARLREAKTVVAGVATDQRARLRDAMCMQRTFTVADFEQYVVGNPVMGRLATRLVWAALAGEDRTLFRPLSDGTLLDVTDDPVDLIEADAVALAHEVIDGVDAGDRWAAHLADYEVAPLFAQFDRPSLPAPPGQRAGDERCGDWSELTDWRGAIIDDRALRTVANKVGFHLDAAGDGGAVDSIRRSIPSANLEVRIGVAGLSAMIQETEVALESVRFYSIDEREAVPLGDIPPVLLVETIADVEQIVTAGDGIDPDWESRVGA